MIADPAVREDKLCAWCGGERTIRPNRYSGVAAALDPFCSTACCKAWHGVEFPVPETTPACRARWANRGPKRASFV